LLRAFLLISTVLALAPPAALAGPVQPPASEPSAVPVDPVPRGRLGDAVVPRAYRLYLTVDPAQPRFSGRVEIDITVAHQGMTSFFMHGRGLAMHSATLTAGGRTTGARWTEVDETGVVRLDFDQPLAAGPATLAFDYDAPFGSSAAGMYHFEVGGQWYSWSQFESIDARAAFPGFDQPSFKTPFTLTLRTPPGLIAVGNAPETGQTSENGLAVHHFAPTLPLPTYLVATMVGPFASTATEVAPTPERATPLPLRILAPQPGAGRLAFARDNSARIVPLLEGYFGSAFPFPKLDQVAGPGVGGAMENAGADLYDDTALLIDETAPIHDRREFGMIVAHELAHQWFGDLVTPVWWDDVWLNESFANWMGYRIGDAWRPDLDIASGAVAEAFKAMDTDQLLAGRPIHQPIVRNAQIDASFDDITYGKGGQVVAMIAGFLGDAGFRDGVRRYLAAHRYGNATSDDFYAALAETAGDPRIVAAMRSFTDQQGVPLLTFTGSGSRYHVVQSRYAPYGETPPATRWLVPMCLRRNGARNCSLLVEGEADVTLDGGGPLVPNAGGTGYYRFELPASGWDALIGAAGTLSGAEAQAAADSLTASVRAGRAPTGALARLARALAPGSDSYASDAAMTDLAELASDMVSDPAAWKAWQHYLGKTYAPLLARYGFDPRRGAYAAADPQEAALRSKVVERMLASDRDLMVRPKLVAAAQAWLDGDADVLDDSYRVLALGTYLQAKGLAGARTVMTRALASADPSVREDALTALGISGRSEIAGWLLDVPNSGLRSDERRGLLARIMAAPATREVGYRWLVAHLDQLSAASIGIFFATRVPTMLGGFCSVERADEFARVFGPRFAGKPGQLALDRAVEKVRNCGRLKADRGASIEAEFKKLR
jgi:aminopeptidase N